MMIIPNGIRRQRCWLLTLLLVVIVKTTSASGGATASFSGAAAASRTTPSHSWRTAGIRPSRWQHWHGPQHAPVNRVGGWRGGGGSAAFDDNDDEYYQEKESDDLPEDNIAVVPDAEPGNSPSLLWQAVRWTTRTVWRTVLVANRAIWRAVFASDKSSQDAPAPLIGEDQTATARPTRNNNAVGEQRSSSSKSGVDPMTSYLADSYSVIATRTQLESPPTPLCHGSLVDALQLARHDARLLLVYIPAGQPTHKKTVATDQQALTSFLSAQVARLADQAPPVRRKKDVAAVADTGGSFLLWSAKAGSSDAVQALKRLQVAVTTKRVPILLVVYPGSSSSSKARVLAQHHGNPPPNADTLVAWLRSLQTRHAPLYASLTKARQERQYAQQRQAGYAQSVQADVFRHAREEQATRARQQAERARAAAEQTAQARRQAVLEQLPAEPEEDADNVYTVALRLSDGRRGQRRFAGDTTMQTIFDWLHASFGIEHARLVTLNGQRSFERTEDDVALSLSDTQLPRMLALRVVVVTDDDNVVEASKSS